MARYRFSRNFAGARCNLIDDGGIVVSVKPMF